MNSTNNKSDKNAASTQGTQYYGRDDKGNKALATRYFGKCMVVGIHKPLPEAQQTSGTKYDYKGGTAIYITPKTAKAFSKAVRKALESKQAGETFKSRGFASGNNGMIEVGASSKYGLDGDGICVAIYNVDENKTATATDFFEFKTDISILGFDGRGNYEHEPVDTDIEYFIDELNNFANGMSNGIVHAYKNDTKWSMDKIVMNQLNMMGALGIAQTNNSAVTRTSWDAAPASSNSTNRAFSATPEELSNELENLYQ